MKQFESLFSRRDLIKGLGTLGILSAVQTDTLLAASAEIAPVRVLFVALQHGWGISADSNQAMSGTENAFQFPAGLAPFNSIKEKAVVIDGLMTLGLWGNNHDLSYADILTAGVPMLTESSGFDVHMPLSATPSLDFLLQQQSGKTTFRFSAGYRSWGVSYHPLSFDSQSTVLPFYTSAYGAYNAIFKPAVSSTPKPNDPDVEARLLKNLFQFIKSPAERDLATLSGDEKTKLSRYLSAVADAEAKHKPATNLSGSQKINSIPLESQTSLQDLPNYLEMIKVGFANNLTNSAVLGIGDIHGIDKFHHEHAHADTAVWWQTRTDFAQQITQFVKDLDAIIDTDGNSLLHNTVIVLTGEVGDGTHNITNKGHIIFGGGGGKIATGRYLQQPLVKGYTNINRLTREDINGNLQAQITYGDLNTMKVSARTNADLLREIGNIAGLNLSQFGLASQNNKGSVLT